MSAALPGPAVIVLIGASGSGKSTVARTWPASYRLELDAYRELVAGDAGDQDATADAVRALNTVLTARLARGLTSVIDATNTRVDVRRGLVLAAHDHGLPAVALVVDTPLAQCLARNGRRRGSRRVPENVVRRQHEQIAVARPGLHGEGFDQVVTLTQLLRLRPLLQQAADAHGAALGAGAGTAEPHSMLRQLLARRFFGDDLAAAFAWQLLGAGADPVATLAIGADKLVLIFRTDSDDPAEWGFEAQVPCPSDICDSPAWVPVWTPGDLLDAYDVNVDDDDDAIHCESCGAGVRTALSA